MNVNMSAAAAIVVQHKEEFIKVFPQVAQPIKFLEESKDKPGCKSCIRNKYERDILTVIMLSPKDGLDLGPLMKYDEPQLIGALAYKPKHNEPRPAPDASMPALPPIMPVIKEEMMRDGCPDCVCKHLSQALILMDEVVQGYPEHVKLALAHAERAIRYSTGKNTKTHNKLKELRDSLKGIINEEKSIQSTEFYLERSRVIMNEMLEDNMSHPLSVWRVIGHMGEAADECVQDNPLLASKIREERLALMEDHMYRPPLAKLLNDARKGRE